MLHFFRRKLVVLELHVFDCVVEVHVHSREILSLLRLIYSAFLIPPIDFKVLHRFRYVLGESRQSEARYFVSTPGGETLYTDVLGHALFLFEKEMTIALQKKRNELFFVHAAVCGWANGAFLIAAPSGTGKSTTTWALLHQGFEYFSDELAPIDLDLMQVSAYPRALGLKRKPPFYNLPSSTISTAAGFQVPVDDLLGSYRTDQQVLKALFFLEFDRGGKEIVVEPVSEATATAHLYSNSLNALAHEGRGLAAAAVVAQRVPAFRLVTTEDVGGLADRINEVMEVL